MLPKLGTISIHAPRTGSDANTGATADSVTHFNPRSPHGERLPKNFSCIRSTHFNPRSPHGERQEQAFLRTASTAFQSTLPARGATPPISTPKLKTVSISIHAPRTGSDKASINSRLSDLDFNPRSPHGERPLALRRGAPNYIVFQSTLPARGATSCIVSNHCAIIISIHAPRTGSDRFVAEHPRAVHDFNPRSPHGERLD